MVTSTTLTILLSMVQALPANDDRICSSMYISIHSTLVSPARNR
jgi:hypothetical protein